VVATNNHYAYSTPNDREFCLRQPGRSRPRLRLRRPTNWTAPTWCNGLDVIGSGRENAHAPVGPPQLGRRLYPPPSPAMANTMISVMSPTIFARSHSRIDCLQRAGPHLLRSADLADAENTPALARKKRQRKSKMLSALRKANPVPSGNDEDWVRYFQTTRLG